jgi:quinol monooxygenase YgiN
MSGVFTVVARIYPKAGKEDELQAILVEQAAVVRREEKDCLVYRPHRSAATPTIFLFYEQYRSEAAFELHRTAAHLATFRAQHKALLDRPTEVEIYRALTD